MNIEWGMYHHNAAAFVTFESETAFINAKEKLGNREEKIQLHRFENTKSVKLHKNKQKEKAKVENIKSIYESKNILININLSMFHHMPKLKR